MFLLSHTRIALFATLIAVVVPTVIVALLGLTTSRPWPTSAPSRADCRRWCCRGFAT